jgi:hypothetical protein
MTATARNEASISAADLQASVGKLHAIHLHLANLLSLLENKVEDEGETILHAARRYLNDEFAILKHLEGDDDWDQIPAPKILIPQSEKGGA